MVKKRLMDIMCYTHGHPWVATLPIPKVAHKNKRSSKSTGKTVILTSSACKMELTLAEGNKEKQM